MPVRVAAIIPCFRVKLQILDVLMRIGPEVTLIYVVDDACPEGTADHVQMHCADKRVRLIRHTRNLGVGGAVMTGYQAALADGMQVMVKIDGDGQMDPALLPFFLRPILLAQADYTKGNRFYDLTQVRRMPAIRLVGNVALSFLNKLSTGYWQIFDPTNGFTAIHARVVRELPFEKISQRYFFESDMLFRLNLARAVVLDVPMHAHYGDEKSSLKISRILGEFALKHLRNFSKRVLYSYFLRDMTAASLELVVGLVFLLFGLVFGGWHWWMGAASGVPTPVGTVMLATLPVILGVQLLLSFVHFDVSNQPRRPVHLDLPD